MKHIKKIIALILTAVLVCAASGVYAQPVFDASLKLDTNIKNSDVTYLSFNETFDVQLKLKTGANYFAGPFSAQIFYDNAILKNTSADFNKSSKLYAASKSYSGATQSYSMTAGNKAKFYPSDWAAALKQSLDFCNITMIPNSADCTVSPAGLDENIVTLHFTSGTKTGTGRVFASSDSIKTDANVPGETYLSCLTDSGKVLSKRYDYGTDAKLDLTAASLTFTVTDLGDVDSNQKVNSSDALLILQGVTGLKTLDADAARKSDINCDKSTSSLDALIVLQMATGLARINDIIKK